MSRKAVSKGCRARVAGERPVQVGQGGVEQDHAPFGREHGKADGDLGEGLGQGLHQAVQGLLGADGAIGGNGRVHRPPALPRAGDLVGLAVLVLRPDPVATLVGPVAPEADPVEDARNGPELLRIRSKRGPAQLDVSPVDPGDLARLVLAPDGEGQVLGNAAQDGKLGMDAFEFLGADLDKPGLRLHRLDIDPQPFPGRRPRQVRRPVPGKQPDLVLAVPFAQEARKLGEARLHGPDHAVERGPFVAQAIQEHAARGRGIDKVVTVEQEADRRVLSRDRAVARTAQGGDQGLDQQNRCRRNRKRRGDDIGRNAGHDLFPPDISSMLEKLGRNG